MLRGLALPFPGAGTSTEPEHIEAVTAERDFFRDKYVQQMQDVEQLKDQLKESQRVIDRLRSEILKTEAEKSSSCLEGKLQGSKAASKPKQMSGGSTNTSVTCQTDDDDQTTKSAVEMNAKSVNSVPDVAFVGDNLASPNTVIETKGKETGSNVDSPENDEQSTSSEEEGDDDDEVNTIRANAERMLLWANYQTSKRSVGGSIDTSRTEHRLDDDSSLGSSSRHHPERSVRSSSPNPSPRTSTGKIGNVLNSLKDMVDPPFGSESEYGSDEESTDGSSN